jgi:hypothetical protein
MCIEWQGRRNRQGYGINKKHVLAHRAAWQEAKGPIPEGLCVLHRCDNPACVNVEHLFIGTRADNAADRSAKGRSSRHKAKLTLQQVSEIRKSFGTQRQVAERFGISQTQVFRIKRALQWTQTKGQENG